MRSGLLILPLGLFAPLAIVAIAIAGPLDAAQPTRFSGYVEGSYAWASQATAGTITGELYQRDQSQFITNAFSLGVDRPVRSDTLSAGFTARALFGRNATLIQAAGLTLGDQGDLTQAYGTINFPTSSGWVQFSMGKMATMLGLEVIESVANPNLTVGNQFVFVEDFTHVALDANWAVNEQWSFRAHVLNGWDVAEDNNNAQSFMGRVGWTPVAGTSFLLTGFTGPEQAGNVSDLRTGGELLATVKRGAHTVTFQGDIGQEEGIDANWWAAGVWWVIAPSSRYDLAMRFDVLDDTDGARTSGALGYPVHTGQRLTSATATLNLRMFESALIRPEVRYDQSNLGAFDGEKSQVTLALGAAFLF